MATSQEDGSRITQQVSKGNPDARRGAILTVTVVIIAGFHTLDMIGRILSLLQGRTVTISPHNIVCSPSIGVQVAALLLLSVLIVFCVIVWRFGRSRIRLYLSAATAYWLLIVADHVHRTRIGAYWNLGEALLAGMPVLVGAIILTFASRRREGRS